LRLAQTLTETNTPLQAPSLRTRSALERATRAAQDSLQRAASNEASVPADQAAAAPSGEINALGIPITQMTPEVISAIAKLSEQITSLRADRARIIERLRIAEDLADSDTLVPVFNRRAFVRELNRIISFADRYEVEASLVYFDLDGFKLINDRYGHPAGDAVLKAVGETLRASIRESDLVGRVGGDEFAVILAKASQAEARKKGEQLAEAIRRTKVNYMGHVLGVGAAFGAYAFEAGDTAERAISRADEAMYANKTGRKIQSL
jgi:diguanylate cyclase (GGDEF)-like protein